MSRFIEQYRGDFGVEPICQTLGVSASAYFQRASGHRSARAVEDERLLEQIERVHAANFHCYGYRRSWLALRREGVEVGRDHVKRLMRAHGPKNGFGRYPSEQKVVRIGTERVPLGPGDPPWEHHVNRIRFRVRNVGDGAARDVRVQVSASSVIPLVSGCAARRRLARATIPSIEAGATAIGSIPWVPADEGPVQFEVNVQSPEGEPPLLHHTARSTTAIASVRSQGRRTQVQTVKVRVPRECGVASVAPVVLQTVKGWRIDVRPRFAFPGARRTFRIRARALPGTRPGVAKPAVIGFSVETHHGIESPVGQGAPPVGDDNAFTFSAGLSLRPRLVLPSSVSLQCDGRARAGDPLSLTGRLSPPIANRVVALEMHPPSGRTFVWTTKTRRDGRFQRSQHLTRPGRWTIHAAR